AGLTGLAGLLGALVLALFVVPRLSADVRPVQAALFGLALTGAIVQLASGAGLLVLQAASLSGGVAGTAPRLVTGSEYGSRWLVSTLLCLALAPFLVVLLRRAARSGVPGLLPEFRRLGAWALLSAQARTLLLAAALTAATAVSGHAAG